MTGFGRLRGSRWKLVSLLAAAVAGTAVLAPAATATPPQPANGSVILTGFSQTLVRTAGDNVVFSETNSGLFFGTFTGSFVVHLTRVVHTGAGFATFHGDGTFTGTVAGRFGTFDFVTEGTGSATAPTFESRIETVGTGTGELAGLHAQATLTVVVPFGTYSGSYHFD
jgi:hypothetical protein